MTEQLTLDDLASARSTGLRRRLRAATSTLVLTGAGCSVDSGLPVFTGPGGLYADPETAALSHVDALPESLPGLWSVWGPLREAVRLARPHPGHCALAEWVRRSTAAGAAVTVATQNVDDLHERAGTGPVQHLHGRLDRTRCLTCTYRCDDDAVPHSRVPACPRCGGPLRPGIVLFGERLELDADRATRRAVRVCEVYLAIGTSSVVSTSTGLLRYAGDVGALTVCVDPAATVDSRYDVHVRGTAARVLPLLLA